MTQQDPIAYPFASPPTLYHPLPQLSELREQSPVAPVQFPDGTTAYLVMRYAEVRQVLIDPRFSRARAASTELSQSAFGRLIAESLMGMDPPGHTRLRKLVARAFTNRRVEMLRPRVVKLVDELLDHVVLLPRPVDLVEHFSLPLPVQVICELLGVPATDRGTFHAWSDAVMSEVWGSAEAGEATLRELTGYLSGLIATKRATPADDLMSALITARDEQDRLSEHELVMLCLAVLIGGHETTANQINMFLLTLLRYPDQLALLRADPELIPQAVEELMRFVQLGDAVGGPARIATEDVELGGVKIPAGSALLPAMGSANRDPSQFDGADVLDLTRSENSHLGFGAGVHHCLGAQLARMELQEALRGLLRRIPNLRVAVPDEELSFKPGMVIRSLRSLPVTW